MNRKILLAAIFPVTFFLISLGMRNAYLNGDLHPKPRPRAVIENVEKTPKVAGIAQQQDAEHCQPISAALPASAFVAFDREIHKFTFHVANLSTSRAPPFSPLELS